jgi:hypothetical protein
MLAHEVPHIGAKIGLKQLLVNGPSSRSSQKKSMFPRTTKSQDGQLMSQQSMDQSLSSSQKNNIQNHAQKLSLLHHSQSQNELRKNGKASQMPQVSIE